jgi:hypothetical protein
MITMQQRSSSAANPARKLEETMATGLDEYPQKCTTGQLVT